MKGLILGFTLLLTVNAGHAKTLIVSDIDDTVKVTDVLSGIDVIINGLFSVKEFSGMSELYRQLNSNDTSIFYVSGSPKFVVRQVQNFLGFNQFPQASNLILKKLTLGAYEYKLTEIRKLIKDINPDQIILLGDDTEFDPEIYDQVSKENSGKVKSIYIHSIQDRKIPKNALIKTFLSSVEVAGFELLNGRVTSSGFTKIASAFIDQSNSSTVVIRGRYCPLNGRAQIEELKQTVTEQSEISSLEKTQNKIMVTCFTQKKLSKSDD